MTVHGDTIIMLFEKARNDTSGSVQRVMTHKPLLGHALERMSVVMCSCRISDVHHPSRRTRR